MMRFCQLKSRYYQSLTSYFQAQMEFQKDNEAGTVMAIVLFKKALSQFQHVSCSIVTHPHEELALCVQYIYY